MNDMATPSNKMVTGFNHNIKHKGRVFHVQTEDSGVENPHIITHLFMGGNILASKKTSYADIVHAENLPQLVRTMMEEQQKEMLRNLIRGVYDDVVERYTVRAWQPGVLDTDAPPTPAAGGQPPAPQSPAVPSAPAAPAAAAPPAPTPGAAPQPAPPPAAPTPAAAPAPPPAAPAPAPVPAPAAADPRPEVAAAQRMKDPPKPVEGGDTIFGEDLISERSLDEVILSYLADDGGDP